MGRAHHRASDRIKANPNGPERRAINGQGASSRFRMDPNGPERHAINGQGASGRFRVDPNEPERRAINGQGASGRFRMDPNGPERLSISDLLGNVGLVSGGGGVQIKVFFIEGGSPGLGVCVPALARRYPSWELLAVGFYRCRGEGGTKSGCPKCSQDFNAMENCWHHLRDRLKNHTACWDRVQV
jgi:hypothetical protein